MNLLLRIFFTHCWGSIYLLVGLSLGLSFSLLFVPVDVDEYHETTEQVLAFPNYQSDFDEYEPKINTNSKPQQAQKVPKTFVRPRYYSTELGIREKLFVGIITSQQYLHSRDIAINKTLAHVVDKVRYFISIPEGTKPNVSLPGIVGFTDTRSILQPFHTMKYIIDNYLENYDYYFLVKDISYINAKRINELVAQISVSQNVHVGVPSDVATYCSLDSGILLSNSVIQEVKNNLDWCVKNAFSESDDVNFGRCIEHSASIPCTNSIQGQNFSFVKLKPTFQFERDFNELSKRQNLVDDVVIYPIYDHYLFYKINIYIAAMRAIQVQKKISNTRKAILSTAHLGPPQDQNVSWPIGNQPGNKATGRFDILRWTYFNETHSFFQTDFSSVEELKTNSKFDIEQVINIAANKIVANYKEKLTFKSLLNGYQRFDASRGMDYILDLVFTQVDSNKDIIKRVEVCKPLGKVEILPVPYVTENTRVNIILMVDMYQKQDVLVFLEDYAQNCLEKKYKTFLMLVLLYDSESPSKGKADVYYDIKKLALLLAEKYKKTQSKITWLSVRLPTNSSSIQLNPMLQIAVTDLCIRKFSPESLILFAETGIEFRLDYLNRVRMNTISQFQIFSPIPFTEFHPDIVHMNDAKNIETDINRNHGRYDEHNFNSIAFYAKDYNAMRKTVEMSIPITRTDKDIATLLKLSANTPVTSLFEMFVSFSNVHILRAVEPALKIKYKDINCNNTCNDNVFKSCLKSKNYHLGGRSQLAKLILDYQAYKESFSPFSRQL